MEANRTELLELTQAWESLLFELKKRKKFDFEEFETIFTRTYRFLSEYAGKPAVEREHIPLIICAYAFAQVECNELDYVHRAALVLTERMLRSCVVIGASAPIYGTYVYVFESRKEVYIDFNNVSDSATKLAKLFDVEQDIT